MSGQGVDMAAGLVIDCVIRNNHQAASGGGGADGGGINISGGMVDRCVITNNWASPGTACTGGGVRITGGTIRNSLIAYCQTSGNGGGVFQNGSVRNCTIVWGNTNTADQVICETTGHETAFDTCCMEDPDFRGGETPWQIRNSSPCRDTAKVLDWMAGSLDYFGQPRVFGRKPDIGAVESSSPMGTQLIIR